MELLRQSASWGLSRAICRIFLAVYGENEASIAHIARPALFAALTSVLNLGTDFVSEPHAVLAARLASFTTNGVRHLFVDVGCRNPLIQLQLHPYPNLSRNMSIACVNVLRSSIGDADLAPHGDLRRLLQCDGLAQLFLVFTSTQVPKVRRSAAFALGCVLKGLAIPAKYAPVIAAVGDAVLEGESEDDVSCGCRHLAQLAAVRGMLATYFLSFVLSLFLSFPLFLFFPHTDNHHLLLDCDAVEKGLIALDSTNTDIVQFCLLLIQNLVQFGSCDTRSRVKSLVSADRIAELATHKDAKYVSSAQEITRLLSASFPRWAGRPEQLALAEEAELAQLLPQMREKLAVPGYRGHLSSPPLHASFSLFSLCLPPSHSVPLRLLLPPPLFFVQLSSFSL
jgi:hypothetical protein